MDWDAFFTVHKDLPREGPGTDEEVTWALSLAQVPDGATICDAGGGPGGDVAALLTAPASRVVTLDTSEQFAAQAKARFAGEPRVRATAHDMSDLATLKEAPFDMIWCAGALYFLGIEDGLAAFAKALEPQGIVAFSEPAYFTESPSDRAAAFWEGYPVLAEHDLLARVAAQGFDVLGARPVAEAGWEAYYRPMETRINLLRGGADAKLTEMLNLCAAEAAHWREVRHETGYRLVVARKTT